MSFIQSCFIRKNTPELRKKLKGLGYTYNGRDTESWGVSALYCFDGKYYEVYPAKPSRYHLIIDCGTNEDLFLSIAALRDDSDYMQWFTDGEKWFQNKQNDIELIRYGVGNPINFHKATVEEIIEHFK